MKRALMLPILVIATLPACTKGSIGNLQVSKVIKISDNLDDITVTGVVPPYGPATGGTQIVITGTGFAKDAIVKIGSGECQEVEVVSSESISCTTPAHEFGRVQVEVANVGTIHQQKNQKGFLANAFTFKNAASLKPAAGAAAGGQISTGTGIMMYSTVGAPGVDKQIGVTESEEVIQGRTGFQGVIYNRGSK